MAYNGTSEFPAESLLAVENDFLRDYRQHLAPLVRHYLSSNILERATSGRLPTEAILRGVINGFRATVRSPHRGMRSARRELCEQAAETLCERICKAFGLSQPERQTTSMWFSDLDKEKHDSLRLFKFVLEELKTILDQATDDTLLGYLVR